MSSGAAREEEEGRYPDASRFLARPIAPRAPPEASFDYVFGSEEYYEFNNAFAFFVVNGDNVALLPDGATEAAINNVNCRSNEEYFVGNDVGRSTGSPPGGRRGRCRWRAGAGTR